MKMRYLDLFRTYVQSAEELAKIGDVNGSLESLRQIPLYDFGAILFNLPSSDQPFLSAVLPSMAKPDVQQAWTGAVGLANLRGSLSFISALTYGYQAVTSKPLNGASVLD